MSSSRKLFQLLNVFSFKIGFNYKRSKYYHSFFGFFLSCVVIIISGYLMYSLSSDWFNKTNPTIISSESIILKNNDTEKFELKDIFKNFTILRKY